MRQSAWSKAVNMYAEELLEDFVNNYGMNTTPTEEMLLNGAISWSEYSYGGCSLIYDGDIAERVCSPSEYKKTREGQRRPNSRETWLDVQARALFQASRQIIRACKRGGKQ